MDPCKECSGEGVLTVEGEDVFVKCQGCGRETEKFDITEDYIGSLLFGGSDNARLAWYYMNRTERS